MNFLKIIDIFKKEEMAMATELAVNVITKSMFEDAGNITNSSWEKN